MKRLALTGVLVAAVVPAPGVEGANVRSSHLGDPGRFLTSVVADIARNDYEHAWLGLYPGHQRVAPLDEYVACELKSPIPGRLEAAVIVRSVRTSFPVAGQRRPLRGAAVTFRIRISDSALAGSVDVRATFHAVPVAGRWRWILPAERYELYRADGC
jgi:hypothetical protein